MSIHSIYSGYTHASCKKMRACAIEVLGRTLQEKSVVCFDDTEAQILRQIIEKLGTAEDVQKINQPDQI